MSSALPTQFEVLFDSNPAPTLVIDISLDVIYQNSAYFDFLRTNEISIGSNSLTKYLTNSSINELKNNLALLNHESPYMSQVLQFQSGNPKSIESPVNIRMIENNCFVIFIEPNRDIASRIISNIAEGVFEFDLVSNTVWTSDRFRGILGYKPNDEFEYGVEAWMNRVHPDDRSYAEQKFAEHITKKLPYEVLYRMKTKQGNYIWVEIKGESKRNQADIAIFLSGTMSDVTEKMEIIENNKRLLSIIEHTTDFIGYADTNGISLFVNPAFKKIVGDNKKLVGVPINIFHSEKGQKLIFEKGLPTAKKNGIWEGENELLVKDNKLITVDQLIMCHKDTKGNVLYFSTIMRDNRQRKELQALQETSHQQLNRILSANAAGIIIGNIQGEIISANNYFLKMLKYKQTDLPIRWDLDLTPEEWKSKDEEKLKEVSIKGYATPWFKEYFKKDGFTRVPILVSVVMFDKENFIAFVLDQTEQREAEKKLQEKLEELENFTQILAHDFTAPVGRISQLLELTLSDEIQENSKKDILQKAHKQTEGVIENIQILARTLSLNTHEDNWSNFKWTDVINQACENLEVAISAKKAKLNIKASGEYYGDQVKFIIVFQNLISNAMKFCKRSPEIDIQVTVENQKQLITIKDNGIGIKPNHYNKIFQAFGRAGNTNEYPGLGLGLYGVKSIIKQHGGTIKVESNLSSGSVFTIQLGRNNKT